MQATKLLGDIYKSYIFKNLAGDVSKFVVRNLRDVEWDKEYWLHKAGLTTYKPGRAALGSTSLFILGALAGGAVALALAPKTGPEFRADVADKARDLMAKANVKAASLTEETARA